MLMIDDCVVLMQNVATWAPSCPSSARLPWRWIAPTPLPVGKQGLVVSLEQQTWEMPPLESMQFPLASCVEQAFPVQPAVQAPPPQPSSALWPIDLQGSGPGVLTFSVVKGRSMSRLAWRRFAVGMHEVDRV